MRKEDLNRLAEQLVSQATKTKEGDKLLITLRGVSKEGKVLAKACKEYAESIGAGATISERGSAYINKVIKNATPESLLQVGKEEMELVQAHTTNVNICDDADLAKIDGDTSDYNKAINNSRTYRVNNLRWLVVNAPSAAFAQACGMDKPTFEKFYMDVHGIDYGRMAQAVIPLQELMAKTEHIRITGPNTDLEGLKKNMGAIPCTGELNLPDGECFTAFNKFSLNGQIQFGPSTYDGKKFSRILVRYTEGYISHAEAGNEAETVELNRILDRDGGARFTGEFAIGFHPHIGESVGDILYDEKRRRSVHIAQGKAYEIEDGLVDNGNRSSVHWDMVHSQDPKDGGGRLFFDDKLIRVDGEFIEPDLEGLNPENLI